MQLYYDKGSNFVSRVQCNLSSTVKPKFTRVSGDQDTGFPGPDVTFPHSHFAPAPFGINRKNSLLVKGPLTLYLWEPIIVVVNGVNGGRGAMRRHFDQNIIQQQGTHVPGTQVLFHIIISVLLLGCHPGLRLENDLSDQPGNGVQLPEISQ
jgi:hypothetical protein